MVKNLQKASGISAFVSAASYLFAFGLFMTFMQPLVDPNLGINEYAAFLTANKPLTFVWIFSMYIIHGLSLVVLVLAVHERIKDQAPQLAPIASALGFIWTSFVLLSGFINIWGNEALVAIHGKDPGSAETFKTVLTQITLGIDSSDRLLASLWIGLVCLSAFKSRIFPKTLNLFGMAFSLAAIITSLILQPTDPSASFVFALGAIIWWILIGVLMVRRQKIGDQAL